MKISKASEVGEGWGFICFGGLDDETTTFQSGLLPTELGDRGVGTEALGGRQEGRGDEGGERRADLCVHPTKSASWVRAS